MKKRGKKQRWLDKIGDYRVLGMSLRNWLGILLAACGLMLLIWFAIYQLSTPVTAEIFVAEVGSKWTQPGGTRSGAAYTIYFVQLKRDDNNLTCDMSPLLVHLWNGLEVGKKYEFSVNRTSTGRCFIVNAIAVKPAP